MSGHPIVDAVQGTTFTYTDEVRLHDELATALAAAGVDHAREVRLSGRDRIDFLTADGCGVEVKVAGPRASVLRQLHRYAEHDDVRTLALVTTQAHHLTRMPTHLNGKPLTVVPLIGQAF